MQLIPDIMFQIGARLPNREIDNLTRVFRIFNTRRVTSLILQPLDKTWTAICNAVHFIKRFHEVSHGWRVQIIDSQTDIQLRQMMPIGLA